MARQKHFGSIEERILSQIEIQPNGCWWWTGRLNRDGYGVMTVDGSPRLVHRLSYVCKHGQFPPDRPISDHSCHDPQTCPGGVTCPHRRCANPDHIEPSTKSYNSGADRCSTEGIILARRAASISTTHCHNGHLYTPENTLTNKHGWRQCRECANTRQRDRYHRLKSAE